MSDAQGMGGIISDDNDSFGPQAQQFGGFAPGKRVFCRTPKIPIGSVGKPDFRISRIQRSPEWPKTHQLLVVMRQIRQASSVVDFNGELNLLLGKRIRQTHTEEFPRGKPYFPLPLFGKPKAINAGCAHGLSLWDLRTTTI